MSTFDTDLVSKPVLTDDTYLNLVKNLFLGIDLLNHYGSLVCWGKDIDDLNNLLSPYMIKKNTNQLGLGHLTSLSELATNDKSEYLTTPAILKVHNGRPVVSIDCGSLRKGDVLGFLYQLSQMPTSLRPVVIINGITDLPPEDVNHDNPEYVENLLLHVWKDDTRELYHPTDGRFVLNTRDYTVLIPILWSNRHRINLSRLVNDNLAQIQLDEKLKRWDLFDSQQLCFLEKRGWLSSDHVNEVREYIKNCRCRPVR